MKREPSEWKQAEQGLSAAAPAGRIGSEISEPRYTKFLDPVSMRILVTVARMYYERQITQAQIAQDLHFSQSRVSRLLKQAQEAGIVEIRVKAPEGFHAELESEVERKYHARKVVVASTWETEGGYTLIESLGEAAAAYLPIELSGTQHIGVSSWSTALHATVRAMERVSGLSASYVTQLIGGVGVASAQARATQLVERMAKVLGADYRMLPFPAVLDSAASRDVMLNEAIVRESVEAWKSVDVALVGIGTLEPSELLVSSGNTLGENDARTLRSIGAVGDVVLRHYDAYGSFVGQDIASRIIGIGAEDYRRIPVRIGIAGGKAKHRSIRAALRGGWINVLVTDVGTAEFLVT